MAHNPTTCTWKPAPGRLMAKEEIGSRYIGSRGCQDGWQFQTYLLADQAGNDGRQACILGRFRARNAVGSGMLFAETTGEKKKVCGPPSPLLLMGQLLWSPELSKNASLRVSGCSRAYSCLWLQMMTSLAQWRNGNNDTRAWLLQGWT